MRRPFTILALLLVSVQVGTAQEEPQKEARLQAALRFNAAQNEQWQIRWDSSTGTPASLLDHKITKYKGTPAQAALAFLRAEKAMFGIEDADRNLRLAKNTAEFGGTQVLYQQVYEGVPVLYSGYLVVVDGTYYPDLAVNTQPALQSEAALSVVRSDLPGKVEA